MISIKRKKQGFSLAELMVAMVIGLFLTLGVFSMFNMSSTNVTTTTQFNQLQENGRIALALIERDVSQLGFMGDMTGTDFIIGGNTRVVADPIPASADCVGAGANNSSLPNNTPAHFRRLWGYTVGLGGQSLACVPGARRNTDVLQVKRLQGPALPPGATSASLETSSYYMGTTANEAVIFSTSQGIQAVTNARYWQYLHHVYYIENEGNMPVLKRRVLKEGGMTVSPANVEQLVEGIENMRILYGFDNDGDDTADSFMSAANVTSLMWDNELFQRLVAVRVFLLVRATEADRSYTNTNQYTLGDTVLGAVNDNFRRKVVSSTIVLENPVLIRN